MLVKTRELTGAALDWAVAKCEGWKTTKVNGVLMLRHYHPDAAHTPHCYIEDFGYSSKWAQGGPILSRERISRTIDHSGLWVAYWTSGYVEGDEGLLYMHCDSSELVAGLRCYVEKQYGKEVEVPDELL